jgi:hypothetical protein
MSKSPPPEAPDVVVSSPPTPRTTLKVSAEEPTTGIPLEGLSRQQNDDKANAAASITLVSDRKGKGKARAVDPVDELENYDLQEEADAVRMESTHDHGVFRDDNYAAEYASEEVPPGNGAYPPTGDDDLEERRVTEVCAAAYSVIKSLCFHSHIFYISAHELLTSAVIAFCEYRLLSAGRRPSDRDGKHCASQIVLQTRIEIP